MLIFHFPSFVLKTATHSVLQIFLQKLRILNNFTSAVTKPDKPTICRHSYWNPSAFSRGSFVWYLKVLQWQITEQSWVTVTGETKEGGVREINPLRQKISFKLPLLYDSEVIQHEAEFPTESQMKQPLLWAIKTQHLHSLCILFYGH